jgi:ribonuclease HII
VRRPPATRSPFSLAALRARAEAAQGEAALRRLEQLLVADARAGARTLAACCARRREALAAERRRVARLFALRRRLRRSGALRVAGIDEVGVGPLAGPVVAAAVVLADRVSLAGLDDSKRLTAGQREALDRAIRAQAVDLCIAEVWPDEIERLNVLGASLAAMARAVSGLAEPPDHLLVDARVIPDTPIPQTAIVGGDALDGSIAAASVVAKVHRDALMRRLDQRYPGWGFARHKGYATAEHLKQLRERGPSPIHRRSFAPVAQLGLFPSA